MCLSHWQGVKKLCMPQTGAGCSWWGVPASRVAGLWSAGMLAPQLRLPRGTHCACRTPAVFHRLCNTFMPHTSCTVQPEDVPGMKEAGWSAGNAFKAG